MPKGELQAREEHGTVSATPSPSASRSSVMRSALGTPAPAFSMHLLHHPALDALDCSVSGGAAWSFPPPARRRWAARAASAGGPGPATPWAATGLPPAGQPLAGAICTVVTVVMAGVIAAVMPRVMAGVMPAANRPLRRDDMVVPGDADGCMLRLPRRLLVGEALTLLRDGFDARGIVHLAPRPFAFTPYTGARLAASERNVLSTTSRESNTP
jgi:hypothetical protein